ncbi:MAG TPA: hypothetical protein VMZ27_01170 [Candidatus Saccharimonadales bacterium]|nr:hypothetical protein [Candidatus Saccharimonadales bacterium]
MTSNNNAAVIVPPPSATALATNDIHGARPPVPVPNGWLWAFWIAGILLVLAAASVALVFWRKKLVAPKPVPIIPPHVRAKQKLAAALQFISDPKLFCTMVSDTLRIYLEERFRFRAPERTTDEFLVELQSTHHLTPDQKISLAEFLQSCDLVKFARFEPEEQNLRTLHEAALRLIDETQFEPIEAVPSGAPARKLQGPPALPPITTADTRK